MKRKNNSHLKHLRAKTSRTMIINSNAQFKVATKVIKLVMGLGDTSMLPTWWSKGLNVTTAPWDSLRKYTARNMSTNTQGLNHTLVIGQDAPWLLDRDQATSDTLGSSTEMSSQSATKSKIPNLTMKTWT